MARQRIKYKLIGRYVRGNDTVYYSLVSEAGKQAKCTEEQMAFLVGRGQVINVSAQLYRDKILFRGLGCDIKSLPTISLGSDNTTRPKPVVTPRPVVQPKPVVTSKPVMQPKPVVQPRPVVQPKPQPQKEHKISGGLAMTIKAYIEDFDDNIDTYEKAVSFLLNKYNNFAYKMTKTTEFFDFTEDEYTCNLYLRCIKDDAYYIDMDIWESQDKYHIAVSKSTYQLITYEYPNLIRDARSGNVDLSQYRYAHYHELAIRAFLFSRIPQYKKLKIRFMEYNTGLFDDKIPHSLVVMIGQYKTDIKFDDLEGCAGYSQKGAYKGIPSIIVFNYSSFKSVDSIDNLCRVDVCTYLHEMCHAYVNAVYGSNYEEDPALRGDVLYGIDKEKHPVQYKYHGKKFGDTLKMISDKTGLSFDELFRYNVHIDNTKRVTDLTSHLVIGDYRRNVRYEGSDQIFTDKKHSVKHGPHKWTYRKVYDTIKKSLYDKQNELSDFFERKFGIQLIFDITDEQSIVTTVDKIGQHRKYDINFYELEQALLVYRFYSDSDTALIHTEYIQSAKDTLTLLKKILSTIYLDTIND